MESEESKPTSCPAGIFDAGATAKGTQRELALIVAFSSKRAKRIKVHTQSASPYYASSGILYFIITVGLSTFFCDTQKMNKSVTFSSVVQCRPTLSRWDLTDDERDDIWPSTTDRQRAQAEALETCRVMRGLLTFNGEIHPDAEACLLSQGHTLRGIEHLRSQTSSALRRHRRADMVDAVLEMQYYHCYPHGGPTPASKNDALTQQDETRISLSLAETSMNKSMKARAEAAARGQSDAEWARVINEVEDMMILDNNPNNQYKAQFINGERENSQQARYQKKRADDAAGKGKRNSRLLDRVGRFIHVGMAEECKQVASISA